MDINRFLDSVDASNMVNIPYEIHVLLQELGFNEYNFKYPTEEENRITYCYYHYWTCKDTTVGVRVWYLLLPDERLPVCISFQPYRKADEEFFWVSEYGFQKTRDYIVSLMDFRPKYLTHETLDKKLEELERVEHKKFETKNILELKNKMTLKFGHLKSYDFPVNSEEALSAVEEYEESEMENGDWHPTTEMLLCKVIEFCEDGQIYLWWDQKYVTVKEAKEYVFNSFRDGKNEKEKKKVEEQPKKKGWLKTIFGS